MNDAGLDSSRLRQAYRTLQETTPHLRIRDAARRLQVSEMELLCLSMSETVIRLHSDWAQTFHELPKLGRIMALTRNDSAVHERKGVFPSLSIQGDLAVALSEDIDVRFDFSQWGHGFAVCETSERSERKSLQFFDASGEALHKIYLTPNSNINAYQSLVAALQHESQLAPAIKKLQRNRSSFTQVQSLEAMRAEFLSSGYAPSDPIWMTEHPIAPDKTHRVVRTSKSKQSLAFILESSAAQELPLCIAVGNQGAMQFHHGKVKNIKMMGNWVNVLDPGFNLHALEDDITENHILENDCGVQTLDLHTSEGGRIALISTAKSAGTEEHARWRDILDALK